MFKSFRNINKNAQLHVDRNTQFMNLFQPTNTTNHLEVDEINKLFRIKQGMSLILHYDELVDYKLIVDDEEVITGGLGIGRALVGGALTGGIGALLGGLTKKKKKKRYITSLNLQIRYKFNEEVQTSILSFIRGKTKVKSAVHRKAVNDSELALLILDDIAGAKEEAKISASPADELLKYKELLDMNAITPEEFEEVKKKLLDI